MLRLCIGVKYTFHEFGHVIYQGKRQHKVLKFDNLVRSSQLKGYNYKDIRTLSGSRNYTPIPLSPRVPDEIHNRPIK